MNLALKVSDMTAESHLQKIAIFADIAQDREILQALACLMVEIEFKAFETIIRQGEIGHDMFVLTSGTVSVHKKTAEGDSFKVVSLDGDAYPLLGEAALLDTDARSATVITESPCRCLSLSRKDFDDFGQKFPEKALPVFRKVGCVVMARLRKSSEEMALLYQALVQEIRKG